MIIYKEIDLSCNAHHIHVYYSTQYLHGLIKPAISRIAIAAATMDHLVRHISLVLKQKWLQNQSILVRDFEME